MPIHLSKKVIIVLFLITFGIIIFLFFPRGAQDTHTSIKDASIQDGHLINNLEVFARIYGYVRYFHPSDEAAEMDWDQFVIYGVNRIKQTNTNEELLMALDELFTPIAPSIHISSQQQVQENDFTDIPPDAVLTVLKTQRNQENLFEYISERVYSSGPDSITLFDQSFRYGDNIIHRNLGDVFIRIPTILYASSGQTVGSTNESAEKLTNLKRNMEEYFSTNLIDYDNSDVRLANVIISWNTFQHFYPYFEEVDVNWLAQLPLFLKEMNDAEDREGTYEVMRKLFALLKDSHIGYVMDTSRPLSKLPFRIKYIEGQLVVITSEINDILPGDILLKMDNEDVFEKYQTIMDQTSGSRQWKEQVAAEQLLVSDNKLGAELTLDRNGEIITISVPYRPIQITDSISPYQSVKELVETEPGIYYLNSAHHFPWEDEAFMSKLLNAKGIIVEVRGYPRDFIPFIRRLAKEKFVSAKFLQPQVILPDSDSLNSYEDVGWTVEPITHSINAKVVFLTDAQAVSYAESILGIVEHYKLGEIVGEPTAGTNGTAVEMNLPGGIGLYWTGLKVMNHDGSQLHTIGIQPTVPVKRTIKGVMEGRDEQLEAAIKLIKGN
jgi:hypothetical protein